MSAIWDEVMVKIDYRMYLFRFALAALLALAVFAVVDYRTLQVWDTTESLVVELVDVGVERKLQSESAEEDLFRTVKTGLAVRVLTGVQKNRIFSIIVTQMEGSEIEFKKGGRYILVSDVFDDGTTQYSIADAYRVPSVIAFIVFVCGTLIAFAGRSGAWALTGLLLSIFVLMWGYIPLVTAGKSPLPLAALSVTLIATITVLCVVHRKQARAVALMGTLGGIAGAFLLGYLMVVLWGLTGLAQESASLLATTIPGINIRGILLSSVIIGAVGAVMDVGVSITAAMSELVEYDPRIPLPRLWLAGIRVGGETLGSMINTLILAYLGTSLPVAVLICNAGPNLIGLLNDAYVGQEIVQSLAGTTGLLLTIPVTATVFVFQEKLLSRRHVPGKKEKGRTQ